MAVRVLVVEDNEKNRRLICDILRYHGCDVREAADGETGIAAARDFRPDVILMDIRMPVLDGTAAAAAIRQDPFLSRTRLIALTAFAMRGDRDRFIKAGFDEYIAKPFDTRKLPEIVMRMPAAAPGTRIVVARKIKVLVVADDRDMVRSLCDVLAVNGHDALSAYSGDEAVRIVRAGAPDCLLMDAGMPGIDGIETTRLIRNIAPDLPVILMSAHATDELEAEAAGKGAWAVLSRPVDIEKMLAFLSILRKEQHILVVDDDPLFCRSLADLFSPRGVVVDAESDPGNALGRMEREYELAVLLGLKAGGAGSVDMLKNIRARYPTKPIVLVGDAGEEAGNSLGKSLQNGIYASLRNKDATDQLVATIKDIRSKKLRVVLGKPFVLPQHEA